MGCESSKIPTEHTIKEKIEEYIHDYEYLCLSIGVCLNSVMVGKMYDWWAHLRESMFVLFHMIQVYLRPICFNDILDNPRIDWKGNSSPYLGRSYDVPLSLFDYNVYNTKKLSTVKVLMMKW